MPVETQNENIKLRCETYYNTLSHFRELIVSGQALSTSNISSSSYTHSLQFSLHLLRFNCGFIFTFLY